jgi:hypothetical protein
MYFPVKNLRAHPVLSGPANLRGEYDGAMPVQHDAALQMIFDGTPKHARFHIAPGSSKIL